MGESEDMNCGLEGEILTIQRERESTQAEGRVGVSKVKVKKDNLGFFKRWHKCLSV